MEDIKSFILTGSYQAKEWNRSGKYFWVASQSIYTQLMYVEHI